MRPADAAMRVMRATPWIFPLGVLLGGLFAAFPVAILLYRLTNNLWTMVQQRIVLRRFAADDAGRPAAPAAGPVAAPERVVVVPALRPGAKPPVRPPTSAGSRTGGKAAAGRRTPRRR